VHLHIPKKKVLETLKDFVSASHNGDGPLMEKNTTTHISE
jgi:hypothetical protein|tara:strand:+ start:335 stop:454 length:120 start_codon:yes stop_codon:yes gene_type:complete